MPRPCLGMITAIFLAGCSELGPSGPFAFMDSFRPENFVDALNPCVPQLKAALAVQPGMPLQEVRANLEASGLACAEGSDGAGAVYLDCRAFAEPGSPFAEIGLTLIVRVFSKEGNVTRCEIKGRAKYSRGEKEWDVRSADDRLMPGWSMLVQKSKST